MARYRSESLADWVFESSVVIPVTKGEVCRMDPCQRVSKKMCERGEPSQGLISGSVVSLGHGGILRRNDWTRQNQAVISRTGMLATFNRMQLHGPMGVLMIQILQHGRHGHMPREEQ